MLTKLIKISASPRETVIKPAVLTMATSLVQGIGLVLIAPFLAALLERREEDAALWLAGMCGMLILYGVTQYFAQASCYHGGVRINKTASYMEHEFAAQIRAGNIPKESVEAFYEDIVEEPDFYASILHELGIELTLEELAAAVKK